MNNRTIIMAAMVAVVMMGTASAAETITINNAKITSANTVLVTFDDPGAELTEVTAAKWHIDTTDGGTDPLTPTSAAVTDAGTPWTVTLTFEADSFSDTATAYTAALGLYVEASGVATAGNTNVVVAYDASIAIADAQAPTFTAARTGLDTIVLTFSENVDAAGTVDGSGYTLDAGAVTANTDPVGTSDTMTLTTTGVTGTSATPTVTYGQVAGTTVDAATNEVADGANAVASDGVSPTLTISTVPTSPSKTKTALVYTFEFSEAVTGFAVGDITLDFASVGAGAVDGSTFAGADATYTLTLDGGNDATDLAALTTGQTVVASVDMTALTDIATNAGSGATTNTWTYDVTAPTLSSAARNSDTQITVTMSEAVVDPTAANTGGFTVTETGVGTATYPVSAIADGASAELVVLTVADMAASDAAGVTVTYTAGGEGLIADTAGNALETDDTGVVVAAWGTVPTVAGALDTLYVDVDGQDCENVTALTITSTAASDIKDGSTINITLSDANVAFDLSQEPDINSSGALATDKLVVTKFTATEIRIEVSGAASDGSEVITLGGVTALRINLSAGTPSTAVVNFTVKTTPAVGSLKSQDYDALNIVREVPSDVTITHNDVDSSVTAGTNVVLTAHATSTHITDYGGWQVNFSVTDAPSPLTWTANGLNSSFDNNSLDQYEEVTTGSDGDATLNLKLSTRSSEEDDDTKTDVKAHLNGTAVSVLLSAAPDESITTVDDYEAHVNVTSDYESAVADGAELITFTAQLRDQYDNFVQAGGNITSGIGVGLTGDALPEIALPSAFEAGEATFDVQDATQESVTATVDSVVRTERVVRQMRAV